MNCANHPDRERVAFCQNCGKALCTECVRNVGSSVFCEPCLTARVAGTAPGRGYGYAAMPPIVPHGLPGEPNPRVAAAIGWIPGVGAMYNEQYAKGFVHLVVFAVLISLASEGNDVLGVFAGIFIPGWIIYMVIEAHHTARARRDGTPLPNPFGLNDLSERLGFGRAWPGGIPPATPYQGPPSPGPDPAGAYVPPSNPYEPPYSYTYVPPVSDWGAPQNSGQYGMPNTPPGVPIPPDPSLNLPYYRRLPIGAIWLIVLGLFFLMGRLPIFIFHGRFFGPIFMVGLGVWLFVRKMTSTGHGIENDGTPMYHWRLAQAVQGSFWVVLTGFIWFLDESGILSWGRSWPLWIIGAGVVAIVRRSANPGYGYGYPPPVAVPPVVATPPAATAPVTTTDLVRSDPQDKPASDDQEGL